MIVERLTDPQASNWVDRGQAPEPELSRVLEHYLRPALLPPARLREHVLAIRGLAEADATEVHVAGYLKRLEGELDLPAEASRPRRAVAIAMWHIVKCAEVRDRARRLIEHGTRTGG
jgi:hypothetical protein